MTKPVKLSPIILGPLRTDLLKAGGIVLADGDVGFSIRAQKHAMARHAADYADCLVNLPEAVATPTHVGQSPHHPEGFELVRDTGGIIVLVAVLLIPNADGLYAATSTYTLKRDTLERRIRKGHLIIA
ncbi:hypothetical protein EFV37_01050 [Mesorhizobium loti]|uniref:Uncharacterized protein n=1 Tax=Mesorhizobium jarvisii TaxID=1777867 RepID=A0A6M7T989_9HYPH|nr:MULTISPECIES: hypothetical protein [Mesorhizobium]QKC61059.1 hypothetical protein EB229_01050 [Mesorhizobium jarvisii]QKD06968.1 hypothetical protein EFV37_01050 [Mesorhizobium loti]RJT34529.1 hypothetical protein D3242_11975 [Mesorhizobium jarvisii]